HGTTQREVMDRMIAKDAALALRPGAPAPSTQRVAAGPFNLHREPPRRIVGDGRTNAARDGSPAGRVAILMNRNEAEFRPPRMQPREFARVIARVYEWPLADHVNSAVVGGDDCGRVRAGWRGYHQ